MKRLTSVARPIFLLIGVALMCRVHAEDLPREEVRILVWKQMNPGDPEGWKARMQELQTRPDIKPDLFAMITEAYEKKDWEQLAPPLLALRLRNDLSTEELSLIVNPLLDHERKPEPLDMMTKSFVCGALPVLRHYPSDKHENLALAYLARTDTTIQENALNTLAAIGTERSLPALNAFAAKIRPAPGNKSRLYDTVSEAVTQIEGRVRTGASKSSTTTTQGQ